MRNPDCRPVFDMAGLLSSMLVLLLAGCDGRTTVPDAGNSPPPNAPPSSPPPPPPPSTSVANLTDGHYSGTATDGDGQHYYRVEALITVDGMVRISLMPPYSYGESIDGEESLLFAGNVSFNGPAGDGAGVVTGQNCDAVDAGRFCVSPSPATVDFVRNPITSDSTYPSVTALLTVFVDDGETSFDIDLAAWSSYYRLYGGLTTGMYAGPRGQFREFEASFAEAGDVVISIDDTGMFFFQSPASNCVGYGMLQNHFDGRRFVFDVGITIADCNSSFASLNGEFEGLATSMPSNPWNYDDWLLMMLSTPPGSAKPAALTMLAAAIYADN